MLNEAVLLKHLYYFRRPYRCHSSNSSMFKWLNNASTHERKYISDERPPTSSSDENTSHKIASHNEDDQESYRKVENQQKFEKK